MYYSDADPTPRKWDGYDATEQTRDAQQYIVDHAGTDKPFMLVLSWGPPHNPYQTAPQQYRDRFDPAKIQLRPNVSPECQEQARKDLAGYYAHTAALDDLLGDLMNTLESQGIADDTLLVFWSDHGDMIGSQGHQRKQRPWDESIRVPLVMRYARRLGTKARQIDTPITTLDLMPTLLGMSGIKVPDTCEGVDYTPHIREGGPAPTDAALIACFHPFGEYERANNGREYRGVRTNRYTYARTLDGPWLLYDNETDPYQLRNLVNDPAHAAVQQDLEAKLQRLLDAHDDKFEHGDVYIKRWGYIVDERGTVPYQG
jgi:arylsulfatase A-like enzyme